jgi:hypothetical protein
MSRVAELKRSGIVAICVVLASGCSASQVAPAQVQSSPAVHAFAGGCAGTIVSDAEPPAWAQADWHGHAKGTPWSVPWALGTPSTAVAFLFAGQLVAGVSPRVNGTNNKILWVAKDAEWGFVVQGRPLGETQPIVSVVGGPSIVDAPTAGCWTFQLSSSSNGSHISTFNLDILPTGTLPAN